MVRRTDHNTEDFSSLLDDVESRIFNVLPDKTWVYPGHGDDSTLGAKRLKLTEWRSEQPSGDTPGGRPDYRGDG